MCLSTGEKEQGGKEKWDGDQRLFMPARRRGRIGKGQGVRGSVPRGGENGEGRGGPGHGVGWLGQPALALGRWVRAAPLPCNWGGRRGTSDAGASG
jgi:hypothetical protein